MSFLVFFAQKKKNHLNVCDFVAKFSALIIGKYLFVNLSWPVEPWIDSISFKFCLKQKSSHILCNIVRALDYPPWKVPSFVKEKI